MKKKVICVKHTEYRRTTRKTILGKKDEDGFMDICDCGDPNETTCPERKTCRPYKVTYEFIKEIPSK